MIGVAGQNGGGAVELLQQHDPHQLMRPGGAPKASLSLARSRRLAPARRRRRSQSRPPGGLPRATPAAAPASAALSRFSPRSSRMTTMAPSGMTLAIAIDSSTRRRSASWARLSRISTISISRRPSARPVASRALPIGLGELALGPLLQAADRGDDDTHRRDSG